MPMQSRESLGGVRRFAVIDDAPAAAFYPSYDIALLAGEDLRLRELLATVDAGSHPDFPVQLRQARLWFGACAQAWLERAGPAEAAADAELRSVNTRILRRNGPALANYIAVGPDGDGSSFYDRLAARYLHAVYGATVPAAGIRAMLEPVHASLALHRLWRQTARPHIEVYEGADLAWRGIGHDDAVAMVRRFARLYRSPGRRVEHSLETPVARAKWQRLCRRAVLLPGLSADGLFDTACELWRAADLEFGLAPGNDGRLLRQRFLHLAQWREASRRSLS